MLSQRDPTQNQVGLLETYKTKRHACILNENTAKILNFSSSWKTF